MSNAIAPVQHAAPPTEAPPSAVPKVQTTEAGTQNATPQDKVTISNSAKQALANQTKPAGG